MEKVKEYMNKYGLITFIIIFAIVKQIMVSNIPIEAYTNQVYDDDMMVQMTKTIENNQWLGEYNCNTLLKGPMFPIILSIINYLGLSYISTMNLIYTFACIFFIYTIKDLFKKKKSLFAIYIVLLFNPVSYACWTLQRIYRNGITLSQVLIIIGSFFKIYRNREKPVKKILPYAIIGGLTLATLWLTREDGIWILPFAVVVIIITLILVIKKKIKEKEFHKQSIGRLITIILPLIILIISLNVVKLINYGHYGIYSYNEINNGYFGKVIQIIFSIKTDDKLDRISATRSKIKNLYQYSPTLDSMKDEMEASLDNWAVGKDNELEDGMFLWALKDAGNKKGIYTNAQNANEFYKKIYEELNQAVKEGKLEKEFSMPAKLMPPWRTEYFTKLPYTMLEMTWYIINYQEVETVNSPSIENETGCGIREYEAITNDNAIYPTDNNGDEDISSTYSNRYVNRLNKIKNIYQKLGLFVAIIGFISYLIITIKMIRTKEKKNILDVWLLVTGIGFSLIILIGGVSYNHISAVYSKYYMYLSGAYPLVIIACMISICYILENIKLKNFRLKKKYK